MTNKTPALNKDTVWYQIFLFLAGVVALMQDNEYLISLIGENAGWFMMLSSVIAIGLSFTKPKPTHQERLDSLEDDSDQYGV